jgi:hypothetical protein
MISIKNRQRLKPLAIFDEKLFGDIKYYTDYIQTRENMV